VKPETRFSLLFLGLSIIWRTGLLLSGLADSYVGQFPLLPVLAFLLIAMYRGIESRRKASFSEGFQFMDMFKSGMSIALLSTLMYSLFLYVYLRYLDLSFKSRFILRRIEELRKDGTSQEDIDAWIQTTQSFPFVTAWLMFTFIGLLLISLFYAAAISKMMVRKYKARAGGVV
jgi:hypothetical protein